MSGPSFEFNRITFALPTQSFKVTAFISTEERLPAVTEFVLRLLHTCGRVSLSGFRAYFGFSEPEALAVIESLDRQGYVRLVDDALSLSEQMLTRFEVSPDEYPWVAKLKKRNDVVSFDLLAFTALRRADFAFASDNWIKLNPAENIIGSSVPRARKAYRESFGEIEREAARGRGEVRERSYGVHSIESIEARRTGFVPLTLSVAVDSAGHLAIELPGEFERGAKPELLQVFQERVADEFERHNAATGGDEAEEFIELFKLDFLRPYLTGTHFDFSRYAKDLSEGLAAPLGLHPLFGGLYLTQNAAAIDSALRQARSNVKGTQKHLSSLAWMAPDYNFWGRGEDFKRTVEQLKKTLKGREGDDLHVFDFAEERQEPSVRARYSNTGVSELHLLRPGGLQSAPWVGMLELVLYPCNFAVAMLHLPVDGCPGIRASVGVLTRTTHHLRLVHRLVLDRASGNRYVGRPLPKKQEKKDRPPRGIAEACGFLHYSDCSFGGAGKTSS
jgi:hypothetical protein